MDSWVISSAVTSNVYLLIDIRRGTPDRCCPEKLPVLWTVWITEIFSWNCCCMLFSVVSFWMRSALQLLKGIHGDHFKNMSKSYLICLHWLPWWWGMRQWNVPSETSTRAGLLLNGNTSRLIVISFLYSLLNQTIYPLCVLLVEQQVSIIVYSYDQWSSYYITCAGDANKCK